MTRQEQEAFRDYLRTIEDELLEAVTADYIWLSSQSEDGQPDSRFHWRRGACREECLRRGKPRIWRRAEQGLAGAVGQVA
jgi:hypothetical protein